MKNPWEVLRGQERPSTVFGLYCVLGIVLLTVLFGMFTMAVGDRVPDDAYGILGLLFLTYVVWAHISLWTCAFNAKRRAWGYVARGYAAIMLAVIATSLVRSYLGFAHSDVEVLLLQ